MSKRFYAMVNCSPKEVAIFETEKERDEWVNFQDPLCRDLGIIPEEEIADGWERKAITYSEAFQRVGRRIDYVKGYLQDSVLPYIKWAVNCPMCGGVR